MRIYTTILILSIFSIETYSQDKIRARDLGFDACMYMLHKTFGVPKGGGGPAVGAYGCSSELAPFLPSPLVTIYIPSRNYGIYLSQAIESVVNQSYYSWELIIIDEASEDNSLSIANSFKEMYPKKIKTFGYMDLILIIVKILQKLNGKGIMF